MVTWLQFLTAGLVLASRRVCVFLATPFWSVKRKHSSSSKIKMDTKAYLKNVLKVVLGKETAGAFLPNRKDRQQRRC